MPQASATWHMACYGVKQSANSPFYRAVTHRLQHSSGTVMLGSISMWPFPHVYLFLIYSIFMYSRLGVNTFDSSSQWWNEMLEESIITRHIPYGVVDSKSCPCCRSTSCLFCCVDVATQSRHMSQTTLRAVEVSHRRIIVSEIASINVWLTWCGRAAQAEYETTQVWCLVTAFLLFTMSQLKIPCFCLPMSAPKFTTVRGFQWYSAWTEIFAPFPSSQLPHSPGNNCQQPADQRPTLHNTFDATRCAPTVPQVDAYCRIRCTHPRKKPALNSRSTNYRHLLLRL